MPGTTKSPREYSTNPNTIKSRRRKMKLQGAEKVEDAARTADYKAMIYARKIVQLKPEYAHLSEAEKSTVLENAMRETMEKRRARGQDTLSKMAAFHAGIYRVRDGVTDPQTRVPISAFLEDNGFVPSRPGRIQRRSSNTGPNQIESMKNGSLTPNSVGFAPVADMEGMGSAFAEANGLPSSVNGYKEPECVKSSPRNLRVLVPVRRQLRSKNNLFTSHSPASLTANGFKASETPPNFPNMYAEPIHASIEADGPIANGGHSLAMHQTDSSRLGDICHGLASSSSYSREPDLLNVEAVIDVEKNHVTELELRVSQLEGVVRVIENTALANVVSRVNELENMVDKLNQNVVEGYNVDVAKMKEVVGGIKVALDKVGWFI